MELRCFDDSEQAARAAAAHLAARAREAVSARGRFTLALSGGRSPWAMLAALSAMQLPWREVHLLQCDERVAPDGDDERNWTRIAQILSAAAIPEQNLHPMPVTVDDLDDGAARYAATLREVCGEDRVIDVVHLGLGDDGHTASLAPDDPVLDVRDRDVAVCERYRGRRRLTLTYPAIDRARLRLWLVTGADKAPMLRRLRDGDHAIPAGRVNDQHSIILADREAAGPVEQTVD